MEVLKPCPHCGGEANLINCDSVKRKRIFVYVKCSVCGAQGKTFTIGRNAEMGENNPANKWAANAWNLRTERNGEAWTE